MGYRFHDDETEGAKMARINSEMRVKDAIVEIVDGNPGALTACVDILNNGDSNYLLYLDELGIYGARIYMLWSDVCDRDALKTIAVLCAHQLEIAGLDTQTLNHAIENHGEGIDWGSLEPVMEILRAK
jgi:hypothetical protein